MSHRFVARCLLAAFAVSLVTAAAAEAQSGRIGIVDTRRLLTGSKSGQQVIAQLDRVAEEKGAQLKPRQDEIQALQKRISDGRVSLSEEKLLQLQRELDQKMTAAKRLREDLQREMEQAQVEAFDAFEQKVAPIVEAFGRDEGFLLILNIGFFNQSNLPSGIVWADAGTDVTEELIRRIDAGSS